MKIGLDQNSLILLKRMINSFEGRLPSEFVAEWDKIKIIM